MHPFIAHQAYRPLRDLPIEERIVSLRRPEVREAILAEKLERSGLAALLLSSFHKLFPLGDPPDHELGPDEIGRASCRERV